MSVAGNVQKEKKSPERRCIGCQTPRPKSELMRVVRSPEGEFSLDLTGKKVGRGAYICRSFDCLEQAKKARRFERSFQSAIDPVVFEDLARELARESGDG